jgi:hypothetical protein
LDFFFGFSGFSLFLADAFGIVALLFDTFNSASLFFLLSVLLLFLSFLDGEFLKSEKK